MYAEYKLYFIIRSGNEYPKGTFGVSTFGKNGTSGSGQNNMMATSSGFGARLVSNHCSLNN